MNYIKDLLINNWQLIISVALFILSFILQIVKKSPKIDVFHYVYKLLPDAINEAEKSSLKGVDKLYYALRILLDKLSAYNVKPSRFDYPEIISAIEDMLSTPQKKGGSNDAK